ncbi:MAG: ABC transporter substrate-binding protein [Deltaproteobacteria bacterium]|nr:ABC transporter substrate-binding protein [Deltaproteobacteria bacterium]
MFARVYIRLAPDLRVVLTRAIGGQGGTMNAWRRATAVILLGVCALLLAAPAQGAALKPLALGYGATGWNNLPIWLAYDQGLYRKQGLDMRVVYVGPGIGPQALLSGDVPIMATGTQHFLRLFFGGTDVRIIFSLSKNMYASVIVDPAKVRAPQDLKGKRLGITRFGTVSHMSALYYLKRVGLQPGRDVALIQLGGFPEILAAMKAGAVESAMMIPPITFTARRLGLHELQDFGEFGLDFHQNTGAVLTSTLRAQEDLLLRFMRATVEATALMRRDREGAIRSLGRYTRTEDRTILEASVDYAARYIVDLPYTTLKGIQNVVEVLGVKAPPGTDLVRIIDNRFVEQVEREQRQTPR